MPTVPRTRMRVLELLSEGKALTTPQLRERLGWPCSSGNVWAVIKRLHNEHVIYIAGWKRSFGTRGAMAAKWKLGDRKDKAKPANDRAADNRRYWHGLDPTIRQLRTQKYKGRLNPFTGLYIHAINQTEGPVRQGQERSHSKRTGATNGANSNRQQPTHESAGVITPRSSRGWGWGNAGRIESDNRAGEDQRTVGG